MQGVIRKVDGLGRVSIPIGYRKFQGIENEKAVEIINTDEGILIKRANYGSRPLTLAIEMIEKEIKYSKTEEEKKELARIKLDIIKFFKH